MNAKYVLQHILDNLPKEILLFRKVTVFLVDQIIGRPANNLNYFCDFF
jgi:hypothetical protein